MLTLFLLQWSFSVQRSRSRVLPDMGYAFPELILNILGKHEECFSKLSLVFLSTHTVLTPLKAASLQYTRSLLGKHFFKGSLGSM